MVFSSSLNPQFLIFLLRKLMPGFWYSWLNWSCLWGESCLSNIFFQLDINILSFICLFRGKVEDNRDMQELVISFTGLEEKVIEQYTLAKVCQNLCLVDLEDHFCYNVHWCISNMLFGLSEVDFYLTTYACYASS